MSTCTYIHIYTHTLIRKYIQNTHYYVFAYIHKYIYTDTYLSLCMTCLCIKHLISYDCTITAFLCTKQSARYNYLDNCWVSVISKAQAVINISYFNCFFGWRKQLLCLCRFLVGLLSKKLR